MTELPEANLSGLSEDFSGMGAEGHGITITFFDMLLLGAGVGALRSKDGHLVEGAMKGAAYAGIASFALSALVVGGAAGYLGYKYSQLSPENKERLKREVDSGEFKKRMQAELVR